MAGPTIRHELTSHRFRETWTQIIRITLFKKKFGMGALTLAGFAVAMPYQYIKRVKAASCFYISLVLSTNQFDAAITSTTGMKILIFAIFATS